MSMTFFMDKPKPPTEQAKEKPKQPAGKKKGDARGELRNR